jgi:NAD(P)-dependent dehydrogenase (short-subunit alcohol dehydrogenase family)
MALNVGIRDWTARRIWIIGASSGIGASLAQALLARGARVAVSARRADALTDLIGDRAPGDALALPLDITQPAEIVAAEASLASAWQGYDLVVVMAGDYTPMRAVDFDLARARALLDVNLSGPLNVLAAVVPRLLAQGNGALALVASVAGYRGLPRSLAYGPGKAALINLAESLYFDLHPRGIDVSVINPGFVRTPLTAGNDFEMPALITPEQAAAEILAGFARGDFEIHFPRRFTRLMKLLRHLPYAFYFPLIGWRTRA